MPGGRPSLYTDELADAICEAIATTPRGLDQVCEENEGFPAPSTVWLWTLEKPEFLEKYERARRRQGDNLVREATGIIDTAGLTKEEIMLAKERAHHRRWMAGRLARRDYGDSVKAEVSGPNGGKIELSWKSE